MASSAQTANSEERLSGGKFYGSVAARQALGGAIFTELCHSQARKLPAHSHELPFFCLFFGGDYAEKYGRRDVQYQPFTMSFRPAGVPHQDEVGPRGARMFGIEIERDCQRTLRDGSGDLGIAYDFEGGDSLWLAVQLYSETRTALTPHDLQVESLLSELMGAVACKPESGSAPPYWLRRIFDKLRTEYRERLTMHELALEAGVHPIHLSRVFRRVTGRGIGEYVHRLRVREACERMLKPEASLAEISFDLGFADQSHFTRTFHTITGTSPAAFRSRILRS